MNFQFSHSLLLVLLAVSLHADDSPLPPKVQKLCRDANGKPMVCPKAPKPCPVLQCPTCPPPPPCPACEPCAEPEPIVDDPSKPKWPQDPGKVVIVEKEQEPEPPLEPPSVSLVSGGAWLFTSGFPGKPFQPAARVWVNWPLAGSRRPMGIFVIGELSGIPNIEGGGKAMNDFELSGGAWYKPIPNFAGAFYCEGGFASVYGSDRGPAPFTATPLWGDCGLSFEESSDRLGRLKAGLGADQRTGYGWSVAIEVMGQLRLFSRDRLGVTLIFKGVFPLENNPTGQKVTIVNLGAGLSWDSKKKQ